MTDTETKKSVELTYEKAVELLDRAVEEKGEDYVYERLADDAEPGNETCAYFHGEKPGCIVGHVLAYSGIEPDDLINRESGWIPNQDNLNTYASPETLQQYGVLKADPATLKLLCEAQSKQDEGAFWGEAVEQAKAATA